MALQYTLEKKNYLIQTLDESMDPDLEIPSRIQKPSLKPLQPFYVDIWASLHVNMITLYDGRNIFEQWIYLPFPGKILFPPLSVSSYEKTVIDRKLAVFLKYFRK